VFFVTPLPWLSLGFFYWRDLHRNKLLQFAAGGQFAGLPVGRYIIPTFCNVNLLFIFLPFLTLMEEQINSHFPAKHL